MTRILKLHTRLFLYEQCGCHITSARQCIVLAACCRQCRLVGGERHRVAELERPRGPLCAATQIVEIKTFTLRERYEVLQLQTSCYAAVARRTQNFVPKAFLFVTFCYQPSGNFGSLCISLSVHISI